jgi:hypothetical protein
MAKITPNLIPAAWPNGPTDQRIRTATRFSLSTTARFERNASAFFSGRRRRGRRRQKTPQFDDAVRELELRPILEKDLGRFAIMANPKFEKVLAGVGHNQGLEFCYVAGLHYRWTRRLSPGLEFYGGAGLIDYADPTVFAAV